MADAAVTAAKAQHTSVAGESTAAAVVNTLARAVLALDDEIAEIDAQIAVRFREHRHAEVVLSMPGMGPLLGAEFIACTGGDMEAVGSSGRLAGVAGLAPVPRDSGRISGSMRRPHRYHRRLRTKPLTSLCRPLYGQGSGVRSAGPSRHLRRLTTVMGNQSQEQRHPWKAHRLEHIDLTRNQPDDDRAWHGRPGRRRKRPPPATGSLRLGLNLPVGAHGRPVGRHTLTEPDGRALPPSPRRHPWPRSRKHTTRLRA